MFLNPNFDYKSRFVSSSQVLDFLFLTLKNNVSFGIYYDNKAQNIFIYSLFRDLHGNLSARIQYDEKHYYHLAVFELQYSHSNFHRKIRRSVLLEEIDPKQVLFDIGAINYA